MQIIPLNKKNVNIEDVNIHVTCPECHKSYNVQMKKPNEMKNCRCGRGTFYITATSLQGSKLGIDIVYQHADHHTEQIVPDSVEIE